MEQSVRILKKCIAQARRRIFLHNALLSLLWLAPLAIGAAAILVVHRQFAPGSATATALQTSALVAGLLFLLYQVSRGLGQFEVALRIDRATGLKDRITSALEFADFPMPNAFMQAAVADAQTHCRQLNLRKSFPIWPAGSGRLLLIALLLVPVLAATLTVDFATRFQTERTALSRDLPIEPIPTDVPDMPDLDRIQVPPRLAPLVEPVRNYIEAWKKNLEKMRKEMAKLEVKRQEQIQQAIATDALGPGKEAVAGIHGLRTAITDGRIHLSDLNTMGVHDATEYRDAFAELDQVAFENEPDIEAVASLQQTMLYTADRKSNSAKTISQGAAMAAQMSTDADDIGAFRNSVQGAMHQSFNDFLRNYATHLGDIIDAKKQLVAEAQKSGKPTRMVLSSAPPPPDAKLKMMKLDPNASQKLQLSPKSFSETKELHGVKQGMIPSDSKAGQGGGTEEGATKMQAIETKTEYLEVKGMLGEGKSPIQIIEDLDSFSKEDFSSDEYRLLYADYTEGASDVLDSEQIPVEIKSFIRDYFLSINPDRIHNQPGSKDKENRNPRLAPN